ncbi:hypothetical protein [Streptomyces sp. NPDC055632]
MAPTAVAFSPDGKWFAQGGAASGDAADLTLAFADPSIERQPLRISFEEEAAGHRVVPPGMEFSGDGQQLFVVTSDHEGTRFWLHMIRTREALAPSRFVDVTHGPAVAGEPFTVTGPLDLDGPAPTAAPRITVQRLNGLEVTDLPPVPGLRSPASEDGMFVLQDVLPDRAESVHYVLGYAGDEVHHLSEHRLVVDTVKASSRMTHGGRYTHREQSVPETGAIACSGSSGARRHVGSWAAPTTGDDGASVRARAAVSSSRVACSTASR